MAMAEGNDVIWMLAVDDKLDWTHDPIWAYMMRHVLVAKVCGMWFKGLKNVLLWTQTLMVLILLRMLLLIFLLIMLML